MPKFINNIHMSSGAKLTGLPVPTENTDAATKQYVDQNAGGSPLASNVQFTPEVNTFPQGTDNVDEALKHLFQSANSGKSAIATAIGTPITSNNTFSEMATAITNAKTALDTFIDSAEGTTTGSETLSELTTKLNNVRVFKSRTKLRKIPITSETVVFNTQVSPEKLALNVLKLNGDSLITPSVFVADFNNGDEDDFLPNPNIVFTNNRAEIPVLTSAINYSVIETVAGGTIKEAQFNFSNLNDHLFTTITNDSVTVQTLAETQILIANGDIPISNVGDFQSFRFFAGASTSSNASGSWTNNGAIPGIGQVIASALSFDSGTTWYGWSIANSDFQIINDINSKSEFLSKGIPINIFNIFPQTINQKLEQIRGSSNTLRFAYMLNNPKIGYTVFLDTTEVEGLLKGTLEPANFAVFVSYNASNKTATVTFYEEDTYQINWIDSP